MRNRKKEAGYTLVELLIVCAMLSILTVFCFVIPAVCMGNFWFSESGVMRYVNVTNPEVQGVVLVDRNIFASSRVTVRNSDGTLSTFLVDSNLLFHYTIRKEKSR